MKKSMFGILVYVWNPSILKPENVNKKKTIKTLEKIIKFMVTN